MKIKSLLVTSCFFPVEAPFSEESFLPSSRHLFPLVFRPDDKSGILSVLQCEVMMKHSNRFYSETFDSDRKISQSLMISNHTKVRGASKNRS